LTRHVDTIIIGGGISGASALHWLASAGEDVLLVERAGRLGGVIGSRRNALGALIESGPNSLQLTTPQLGRLIAELGLEEEIVTASDAASNRYVMRDGRLLPLPMNPKAFLKTPVFSAGAKLRLLKEPFIKPAPADADESVASFVERRLGREILDYAVNPFISGIFAGRPERLSIRQAFPRLYSLESEHRSLVRGFIARGRARRKEMGKGEKRPRPAMISFREGMEMLPRAVAERWGDRLLLGTEVRSIDRARGLWQVETGEETIEARNVIIATDALAAAALVEPLDAEAASALAGIEYVPVAVAASVYDRTAVAHPLDGFGMLLPEVERRAVLGTIFSSTLFPGRAPEGTVLLTTFIGGARAPVLALAPAAEIESSVHAELRKILGISAKPRSFDLQVWQRAIPQYTIGYGEILAALQRAESRLPGLSFLGNYRGGISVGDCVRSASPSPL
jgi:oxygen-dependent protoporphyrinogen oxidase